MTSIIRSKTNLFNTNQVTQNNEIKIDFLFVICSDDIKKMGKMIGLREIIIPSTQNNNNKNTTVLLLLFNTAMNV